MRLSRFLLGIVLLFVASPALALTANVNYTASPIQLTGAISQFPSTAKLFELSGQSSDNKATFYGLWDAQYLYIGVHVEDPALFCETLPRDSGVTWANDAVELNFDLKHKKTLTQGDQDFRQWILPIVWTNNPYDAYGCAGHSDPSFSGTLSMSVQLNGTLNDSTADTSYDMIIRVPWTDLALTPSNELTFGFDGAVDDRDGVNAATTIMDWANLTDYAQPELWNALRLTGKPAVSAPDAAVTSPDGGTRLADGGGDQGSAAEAGWFFDLTQGRADMSSAAPDPHGPEAGACDCHLGAAHPASLLALLSLLGLFGLLRSGLRRARRRD